MEKQIIRMDRVKSRAIEALLFLEMWGPSILTRITTGINGERQRTRYALHTLRQDKKAHITGFIRLTGKDNIPRITALYQAGEGTDVECPIKRTAPPVPMVLDWGSTLHLQPYYLDWTATRTPDDFYENDIEDIDGALPR